MKNDDKRIWITDENNQEKEMEILFTFQFDENTNIVVYSEISDADEIEVFASIYNDDKTLEEIDDDKIWDAVENALESFQNEQE